MLISLKVRIVAAVLALVMPLLAGIGGVIFVVLLVFSSNNEEILNSQNLCVGSWNGDGVADRNLNEKQLDVAAAIYAASTETGVGDQGAIVAIATALQESDLGGITEAYTPDENGDVGPFQQRSLVGWYADGASQAENVIILSDAAYASRTFFLGHDSKDGSHIPGLVDIKGWESLPITEAAQKVQRSAFPNAYAKHESLSRSLVSKLSGGQAGPIVCGPSGPIGDCPVFDPAIETNLTPDALRVLRCSKKQWPQLTSYSVYRPGDPKDHGQGKAIDVMIPDWSTSQGGALGTEIAEYFKANAAQYGIKYIIWQTRLWSVDAADRGWRTCTSNPTDRTTQAKCYSGPDDTAAHRDHVHVSVQGNAGAETEALDGFAALSNPLNLGTVLPIERGSYRLTARFNQAGRSWSSGFHTGLDFAAPVGTPIYAVGDGTVLTTSSGGAYGNLTKLQVNGAVIYFAHQSEFLVSEGQKVKAGQVIGKVGVTGNITGPHLHVEVRVGGVGVDPDNWLTFRGANP